MALGIPVLAGSPELLMGYETGYTCRTGEEFGTCQRALAEGGGRRGVLGVGGSARIARQ